MEFGNKWYLMISVLFNYIPLIWVYANICLYAYAYEG